MRHIVSVSVLAGLLATFGFGCNPLESAKSKMEAEIGERVVEKMVEKSTGGSVSMDGDNGQYTFKDNKTGASWSVGENVRIPENFPADIPRYEGARVMSVMVASKEENGAATIVMQTDASVADAVRWYADRMKSDGFVEASSFTAGPLEMRSYEKGNVKMAISISSEGDEGKTGISIVRSEETR
jgi:hypothetical protein